MKKSIMNQAVSLQLKKNRISFRYRWLWLNCFIVVLSVSPWAQAQGYWSGRQIMEEVQRRHHLFPYVYEEHSIVMMDAAGQRDTRQARRYSRLDDDGTVRFLYMFAAPPEVRGVTLMATRDPDGKIAASIYLPAFGGTFLESSGVGSGGNFLGTDFSVEDLTAENLDDYDYERGEDVRMEDIDYFVVNVYPHPRTAEDQSPLRRHYIHRDSFYITRTDHFDQGGRLHKQQHQYDLKQLDEEMWRAGIILMDDRKHNHQSLIKINRRIFSLDYVPAEMFSRDWILAQNPPWPQQGGDTIPTEDEPTDNGMTDGAESEQAP